VGAGPLVPDTGAPQADVKGAELRDVPQGLQGPDRPLLRAVGVGGLCAALAKAEGVGVGGGARGDPRETLRHSRTGSGIRTLPPAAPGRWWTGGTAP